MKVRKIGALILIFVLLFVCLCGCAPDYDRATEKLLKKSKTVNFDNNLDFVEDEDRTSVAYQIIRSMGIKEKIGTHTLRKTFGYHAYIKTKNIALIQKLLNHSSPSVTLRYIGITQDDLDNVYLNLDL